MRSLRAKEKAEYETYVGEARTNIEAMTGAIAVGEHETEWRFTPRTAWTVGPHRLLVDRELEDPCGNSVRAAFEVDAVGPTTERVTTETAVVPFEVTANR